MDQSLRKEFFMTQKEQVLNHIRTHGGITDMDAYQLGICRLSARIHELRNDGYSIETEFVKGKNRFGKKISFGLYKFAHSS